jgi:predicted NBD/HSP70 family sugar kinase
MRDRETQLVASVGTIFRLIRESGGITRAELMEQTGLARATVGLRLSELIAQGLVAEATNAVSTGGRPAGRFMFNAGAGVVLAVDAGAVRVALAVADLAGDLILERSEPRSIDDGPEETLSWVCEALDEMLVEAGRSHADVRAVGIGLPGSVEFTTGRPVSPFRMPGWDGFPVADTLRAHFGVETLVDNDVNVMALGEAHHHGDDEQLVVLKAGTGIGLGQVTDGVVQRGAQGAAGEIGHIRVPGYDDLLCRCGKFGCLEAVAGGVAMAARLTDAGHPCTTAAEVAALARSGVPEAVAMVREAGHAIGFILATIVNVLNPSRLVIAGDLTDARDFLFSALRETVYREANTLATSELEISRAGAGAQAGLIGATTMAVSHALAPATLTRPSAS